MGYGSWNAKSGILEHKVVNWKIHRATEDYQQEDNTEAYIKQGEALNTFETRFRA